jgi:hypothetical protein
MNTTGHLIGSVIAARYSAGLMTAIVFWMPLALLTLLRVVDQTSRRTVVAGVCAGAIVEAAVVTIATLLQN